MNRVIKVKGYMALYVVPMPFNVPCILYDLIFSAIMLSIPPNRSVAPQSADLRDEQQVSLQSRHRCQPVVSSGVSVQEEAGHHERPSCDAGSLAYPCSRSDYGRRMVSLSESPSHSGKTPPQPKMFRGLTKKDTNNPEVVLKVFSRQNTRRKLGLYQACTDSVQCEESVMEAAEAHACDKYLTAKRKRERPDAAIISAIERLDMKFGRLDERFTRGLRTTELEIGRMPLRHQPQEQRDIVHKLNEDLKREQSRVKELEEQLTGARAELEAERATTLQASAVSVSPEGGAVGTQATMSSPRATCSNYMQQAHLAAIYPLPPSALLAPQSPSRPPPRLPPTPGQMNGEAWNSLAPSQPEAVLPSARMLSSIPQASVPTTGLATPMAQLPPSDFPRAYGARCQYPSGYRFSC